MTSKFTLAVVATLALAGTAHAKTQITCLTNAGHLSRQHQPLAEMFNAMQDEVEVTYAAPAQNYSDTHLKLMRASATNTLPDCAFEAYNQLPSLARAMAQRGQIADLSTLMDKEEAGWKDANYSEQMLGLGKVDGVQYGMPFNASVVQWYVNADLLKQAGVEVDDFPTDWDGVLELAAKVDALGDDIDGMSFAVDQWGDDWMFQVLIAQQGGQMLTDAGDEVAFDQDERSLKAMQLARRMVTEGGYDPRTDIDTQLTAFTSGKMGFYANSPASAKLMQERVGEGFDLRSIKFTVWDDANGTLPTGGNAGIITTQDPEKQAAVWEYLKFLTGPKGQELTAKNTGYLPTNVMSLEDEYLGAYYKAEPYFATPSSQYERAGAWWGYPGTQSEKIWRDQRSVFRAVMLGETSPEDGAAEVKDIAETLMKR